MSGTLNYEVHTVQITGGSGTTYTLQFTKADGSTCTTASLTDNVGQADLMKKEIEEQCFTTDGVVTQKITVVYSTDTYTITVK